MKTLQFYVIIVLIVAVHSQFDGSFWWTNKNLMREASHSRSLKEQSARIRTLPPRYRHENENENEQTTASIKSSIFKDNDEDDDGNFYKYDNEPDCVCTPKYLCNENNTIITDGAGIINERAYSICGKNKVCCRIPKATTKKPLTTTTTQRTGYINFNLNLTNLINTILSPVPSWNDKPTEKPFQKCSSRKGKKIEERILIDSDEDDDDDDALSGETKFAEYPWMLEVLKKNRKTGSYDYKCGGVLINPTTALTANHCIKQSRNSHYLIRAGEWDRSSTLEYASHHDRVVSRIISHPQYYSAGLYNDIVILKWQNPLKTEINVASICLPDESESFEHGKYCTVTGWGKTSEHVSTTDKLKFVKVPLVKHRQCQQQFQNNRLGRHFRLHESFICAGGEEGLDSCTNDGGSPLICPRDDGSFVLAGLVSWGLDCGQKNVPGAYTNVKHLLKWIKSHE